MCSCVEYNMLEVGKPVDKSIFYKSLSKPQPIPVHRLAGSFLHTESIK